MTPTKRDAIAALVGLLAGVVAAFGGFKTMPAAFCDGAVKGAMLVPTLDGGVTVATVIAVVPDVVKAAAPIVVDAGLLSAIKMPSLAVKGSADAGK